MFKIAVIGSQCAGKTTVAEKLMFQFHHSRLLKFAKPHYDVLRVLGQGKNRAFMQKFSDVAKEHFGQDIFIEAFKMNCKELEKKSPDLIVCDDLRYQKELDAAKALGFYTVFVDADEEIRRQRAERQGLAFITGHNSEAEVDSLKTQADIIILNNGDIEIVDNGVSAIVGELTANMALRIA